MHKNYICASHTIHKGHPMQPSGAHWEQTANANFILSQGKTLSRQGKRKQAQRSFARLLTLQPDHIEALLWLAALAEDPKESIRYLNRVLVISPDNANALAGLQWAQNRLSPPKKPRPSLTPKTPVNWWDRLLLSGIGLVCLAACVMLLVMAWGTPEAVRAAYQPTPTLPPLSTPTVTPTSTPLPTATPLPTSTATATATPRPTPTATRVSGEPPPTTELGEKWIQLDLSEQRLTAYEGETQMLTALVSTGVASMPTPLGEHRIYRKVRSQVMSGPGYYLPNVEYVSYFLKGYAIHGTYWHTNFGHPMSHGCVNMTNQDAQWIFEWAPRGTLFLVQQ
jgi:lipoprotein-anchoring transpeptidase ErfK/SrfK